MFFLLFALQIFTQIPVKLQTQRSEEFRKSLRSVKQRSVHPGKTCFALA